MSVQEKIIQECGDCHQQMIKSSKNQSKEEAEDFIRMKMRSCKFAPYGCFIAEKIVDYTNSFYSQPQS